MPDEKKHKGRSEVKEQRKPRHGRHQPPADRKDKDKTENKIEEPKEIKAPPAPPKPVYVEPGPEFYKNLKRETDEILKITEEANSKYKKKEIQSNWSKYEMPIESYDEIEEQEHMGADYEKLIQTPLSIGGHFQFKHEKSWDIDTGPSLYDKYFEIDMNSLATALCSIPFYERNNVEKSLFSETDISNMENRSVRFKQKYYNDKSFTTPELEVEDKILSSLVSKDSDSHIDKESEIVVISQDLDKDKVLEEAKIASTEVISSKPSELNIEDTSDLKTKTIDVSLDKNRKATDSKPVDELDDILLFENKQQITIPKEPITIPKIPLDKPEMKSDEIELPKAPKAVEATKSDFKKSLLESPEDLEKWLDDFLDG